MVKIQNMDFEDLTMLLVQSLETGFNCLDAEIKKLSSNDKIEIDSKVAANFQNISFCIDVIKESYNNRKNDVLSYMDVLKGMLHGVSASFKLKRNLGEKLKNEEIDNICNQIIIFKVQLYELCFADEKNKKFIIDSLIDKNKSPLYQYLLSLRTVLQALSYLLLYEVKKLPLLVSTLNFKKHEDDELDLTLYNNVLESVTYIKKMVTTNEALFVPPLYNRVSYEIQTHYYDYNKLKEFIEKLTHDHTILLSYNEALEYINYINALCIEYYKIVSEARKGVKTTHDEGIIKVLRGSDDKLKHERRIP